MPKYPDCITQLRREMGMEGFEGTGNPSPTDTDGGAAA